MSEREAPTKFELSVNTVTNKAVAIQNIPCISRARLYDPPCRCPLIDNCDTKITPHKITVRYYVLLSNSVSLLTNGSFN